MHLIDKEASVAAETNGHHENGTMELDDEGL